MKLQSGEPFPTSQLIMTLFVLVDLTILFLAALGFSLHFQAQWRFQSSSLEKWQGRGSNPDRNLIQAFKATAAMS
ncbi:hypothetical protein CRYUN_Cryun07bG0052800 [Craigia yunnanensis]